MNSVELIKSGDALALELAFKNHNDASNTVHRISAALADLTRWEWLPRGRGVSLCRGGIGVISVWLAPNGWSLRWLDDGQVIDRIVDEASARNTAEQIARSRGFLGAGEVVKLWRPTNAG